MAKGNASIEDFYATGKLLEIILDGLQAARKNVSSLTVADLSSIDEFHTRGRVSTIEVAELAEIKESDLVLEVGCGLGGTARYLADQYKCRVMGIDLTQEYVDVGKELTRLVGLKDGVELRHGNALSLPYQDDIFDIVWTEHVQMNIADKKGFYSELARVLKSNGRLLFHDVFRGEQNPQYYPVPWADEETMSFLATEKEVKETMMHAGLEIESWSSRVEESVTSFSRVLKKIEADGFPPLGIHLLMGRNAKEKLVNYHRNLKENRAVVALGAARKV